MPTGDHCLMAGEEVPPPLPRPPSPGELARLIMMHDAVRPDRVGLFTALSLSLPPRCDLGLTRCLGDTKRTRSGLIYYDPRRFNDFYAGRFMTVALEAEDNMFNAVDGPHPDRPWLFDHTVDPLPSPKPGTLSYHLRALRELKARIQDGLSCKRKSRDYERKVLARKKLKMAQLDAGTPSEHTVEVVRKLFVPLGTSFSIADDVRVPNGAYCGMNQQPDEVPLPHPKASVSLAEAVGTYKMHVIEWDGKTPMPFVDAEGRIFACAAGKPFNDCEAYDADVEKAFAHLERIASMEFSDDSPVEHRRGIFNMIQCGISYGGGQTEPMLLSEGVIGRGKHAQAGREFLLQSYVRRIYNFVVYSLLLFAPKLHQFYREHMKELMNILKRKGREGVDPIYPDDPTFPCSTQNVPPPPSSGKKDHNAAWRPVRTYVHRDVRNFAPGWCSITALGQFDPTKGGHLVLWDLKVVVEFPPGSSILIPSALLSHSNIPVQEGETRASLTFYAPGGLFRWTDNGGRTEAQLMEKDRAKYDIMQQKKAKRWEECLKLYSTLDEAFPTK